MTENDEIKTAETGFLSTKIGKVFLTIVAVFLTFAGPTYIVYGLYSVVKISLGTSIVAGLVIFIIGVGMIWYLVKRQIIA